MRIISTMLIYNILSSIVFITGLLTIFGLVIDADLNTLYADVINYIALLVPRAAQSIMDLVTLPAR